MNKIFRVVWNQATQSWVAVSELTKAHKKQSSSNSLKAVVGTAAVLLSINTAQAAVAIGETNANNTFTQSSAQATGDNSVAIGKASKATAASAVALGEAANANQARAIAIGKGATISSGQDTIAIGTDTNVQGNNSIVIGKNAKITNGTAEGTLVIGRDAFSEGSGNGARPNTVVGRGAYTAFGENGTYRLNAATALGFQAGAGLRTDPNNGNKLVNNETNADSNENVLVKAGYGLQNIQDAAKKVEMDKTKAFLQAGFANNGLDKTGFSGISTDIAKGLSFYRKNHINEATAIGAEARAIGDQSIAIGGQVVAGDGVVALGGNDTDQLRGNKYQVVTDDAVRSTNVGTVDDYNLAYTESTNTVSGQYKKLVGRDMPTGYRSTYGQSGSVVIGMEAHSTTALGTAIGTNSVVRMGAFGATAIGAGSTVQTNAEAAVAIGMGSVANGAYALAGGTASWAEYGDIALGYQAKASGKDGAIAMGRATNAQGDSSIMIGGANIASAAAQNTSYEKANGKIKNETITEIINGRPVQREYSFAGTTPTTGTVAEAYRELTGITMDVAALDFATNKNGHASTSLGVHALSKGDLGTAIGAGSRSDAIGSVALGVGAHATKQNAVAIGTGSTTELVGTRQLSVNYDSDGNIVSDNSDKIAYTFKWAGGINTSEGDVVSFGSSGAERQLKNVAAGRVAEDSTDAINGSQLNSITKKIAVGFNTSGNVVDGSSGEFTSKQKNANVDSTKKDYETAIRSLDKIQLQVGNNLKLDRNETESEIDDPDSPDKNNPLKKKIKKADFAYSLNPILTNLTSAEFKGTDANAPTTMLTNDGVTITPKTAGKSEVSLTQNGLNNGGNPITNVAGNLDGAKTGTNAPTNEAAKPANADTIKNNAATVGDVLNAGWNLKENTTAKDFVTAYDTVNFVDGNGTTVSVENTDGKTSTIKYSVNTGNGLQKDPTGNTISVKPADKSLEVTNKGVKVKAADNTLTTDANGLKVNTGTINPVNSGDKAGTVEINTNDAGKIATVDTVVNAVNKAAWNAIASKTNDGENGGTVKKQAVKAGDTVTFEADKNIKIAQDGSKFTFSTKDNVEFKSVTVGEDKDGKKPVNLTTDKATDVSNNDPANKPTTALNVSSDGKPTQITGVGSTLNVKPVGTNPNGTPTADADKPNLVDLVGTKDAPVNKNAAATVGDLQNMGWVVSTKDGNGYTDVVKNANQVDFKGDGLATVTGETKDGIRTITVNVDAQKTVEAAQNPVVYTDSEGNKVTKLGDNFYPVEEAKDAVKIGDNYYPAGTVLKDGKPVDSEGNEATALVPTDKKTVKASMNNGDNEAAPTVLSNVGSNLPTVDDVKKKAFNPNDSENPLANKSNKAAPITALEAAELLDPTSDKFAGNNAATVSDVLNAGWNLQNNGEARDFVKPYDTVNFINGKGTVAVVETADDATSSTVKFDVDAGEITADTTKPGAVKGPNTTGKTPAELAKNLADAQKAVDDLAKDPLATEDAKQKAQDALKAAQDDSALLNKVATAQNVADMINQSGWNATSAATTGGEVSGTTKELINPSETVTFEAGKNISITQAENKFTFATKDNVEFNTVKVGGDANTYVDDKGNPVTKKEDGSFEDAEGNKVAKDKVSPVAPVTLKTEKASPANNNAEGNHPTTALNVSSDGKPTQLTGVGSVLNTTAVPTTPEGTLNGKAPTEAAKQPKLVNLTNEDGSPLDDAILNSAATVRDIANMGWVVSTKDSNGYKDVVKNANQVDFVGKNGITVTGETKDGIRTITVETAQSPVVYTDKEGNKLVKAGDNFYPADSVVFGDKAYPADSVVIDGNVYPAGTTADDVKAGTATPATALANGKKPADVIASMNNGDDKSANAPMQLGNVAQGAETIAPVDADGNKLVKANDGKYYPEGKVKADGSLEDGTTDADVKQPLKLANDGKWYPADQISAKGVPTDTAKAVTPPAKMDPAAGLVDFANSNPNNAATVGDLQNMGWIVGAPANGYTDQVRNANKVNFVGKGIATVTGETDAEGVRTITVNVANGLVDVAKNAGTATGAVTGPKKAAEDALKAAQEELANATDDAAKKAAQDKIDAAQNALNNAGNLVATAQNVADMINQSGWNATSAATTGGEVSGTTKELINPSETVTFEAGKNISITQAENKFTFATKDDVEFNTVKIANPNGATYTDKNNNPLVKADDDKFYPADQVENGKVKDPATATPVEADKVTTKAAPSVEFKAENATPATNNTGKDKDGKTVEPTTALNISSDDGKPTQLKGVGSVLNTADVNTSTGDQRDTDGNITPAQAGTDKLVDLGTNPKEGDKPLSEETLNSAATVRDLANMGWVVSAKDNNYTNTVKNANKVEFKGKNGISVTGKDVTQQDGTVTREITVAIAEGSVTDKVTITTKDGKEIPAIKIGDNYYSVDKDGKPVGYEVDANGKPTANNKPLDVTGAEIKNNGAGFVTGNTVATAIQESGWNVGLANTADADKAFNDADKALSATKLEKVNPNDNVRFADGKGTKAAVATVERVDEFGKKVTDTYVKFDVDAGKVEAAKDAAGNNTGAVTGPVTTVLNDALTKAQEAKKALKPDATQAEKDAAQAAVDAANLAITNAGNQVATAQNVAEAINNSGWRTNSTTATGGAKDTLINPGKAVNFEAGKNMEVAQTVDKDGNVAYTYKTKDDVQFNSVQFGGDTGPKITNNGGNINVSGPDGKAPTKITGVAAGDISPESSDAVNGAQIYALSRGNVPNVKNITVDGKEYKNVIVDENGTPILKTYNVKGQKEIITNSVVEAIYNMNEQGIKFFHSNDGVERLKVEDKNSFDSSASGKFATAIGSKSSAEGTNAVAIGFNSVVTGNDSISIGTGNRVTGNNSGAFGDPSIINGNSSYSVGNNNTVATNDTFVLGNEVKHTVENSVILGTKSTATAGDGSATATLNNIKQDGTKGTSTTAGSKGTVKQAIVGNMVYGGFEGATADGVVSVGAAGNERRIQNVAAGEISATSTDAINGSQLYSVAQGVGNRLGDLNNKINRNNKNLRAGIAGANAAAGLPQVYIPGKSMVAASAGTYKGQSALAVGYSRASDNGKLILKLQGNANTRGDVGGSVGVGYQW